MLAVCNTCHVALTDLCRVSSSGGMWMFATWTTAVTYAWAFGYPRMDHVAITHRNMDHVVVTSNDDDNNIEQLACRNCQLYRGSCFDHLRAGLWSPTATWTCNIDHVAVTYNKDDSTEHATCRNGQ